MGGDAGGILAEFRRSDEFGMPPSGSKDRKAPSDIDGRVKLQHDESICVQEMVQRILISCQ